MNIIQNHSIMGNNPPFVGAEKCRVSEITLSYHVTREVRGSDTANGEAAYFCSTFYTSKKWKEYCVRYSLRISLFGAGIDGYLK